jgi:ketosteroid isomerase-like protein
MGQAREVMDRVTEAAMSNDAETLKQPYAPDAVAETPDAGTLRGGEAITAWFTGFAEAFPDASWESSQAHECGDTAIDEGYLVGTHTGSLRLPDEQSIPATGKSVRIRGCDAATVQNGRVTSHRFYFDQVEFLGQLGLAPDS